MGETVNSIVVVLGATGNISDKIYSFIMVIFILKYWLNNVAPLV